MWWGLVTTLWWIEEKTMIKKCKSLRGWVRRHRESLDFYIQSAAPGSPKSDEERELWVLNDETLYNWAKQDGVSL